MEMECSISLHNDIHMLMARDYVLFKIYQSKLNAFHKHLSAAYPKWCALPKNALYQIKAPSSEYTWDIYQK